MFSEAALAKRAADTFDPRRPLSGDQNATMNDLMAAIARPLGSSLTLRGHYEEYRYLVYSALDTGGMDAYRTEAARVNDLHGREIGAACRRRDGIATDEDHALLATARERLAKYTR